jgi:nucleotide-binding universal stress UspA family protein
MNILLTADGSDYSKRAARYLAEHVSELAKAPTVYVLYVHALLPYTRAAKIVGKKAIENYYREESEACLAVAEKELRKAGIEFDSTFRKGVVVDEIEKFVKEKKIDLLVMGSRGHGAIANLALGSTTAKVLAAIKTPVLIVR